MTKNVMLVILLCFVFLSYGQQNDKISTIDFVQILNENKLETEYYFQNNWKVLREMAVEKEYIESFQVFETPFTKDAPFHLILITTYANKEQYDLREAHFKLLIEEKGELKLMNGKNPDVFRKIVFSKEGSSNWD